MALLTPPEWLVLDNLRVRNRLCADLPNRLATEALQSLIERGFVAVIDDLEEAAEPRHRITRSGEIALRLSLADVESVAEGGQP